MEIVWDPGKAKANYRKHGVWFSDAEPVLFDPYALTVQDEREEGEDRFVTVGLDGLGRVLVVVYTYRGESIRMISARKAIRTEVEAYEEGI